MFKKDKIFWMATFIFVLGIVIAGITQNQLWLFILVGSYLLRPTLASLNIGRESIDERQMSIQYRAGNIAFAVMVIGSIVISIWESSRGDHSWEFFNAIVILGIAARALANVILIGNYRESATKIIMTVGLMVILFVTLENGFSLGGLIESLPGLGIVGVGWLSKKYPKTIGGIIFVITIAMLFLILSRGFVIGQFITAVLITVPLGTAGIGLTIGDRRKDDSDDVHA
ncbi:MAG: hypothetical protein HY964_02705 [Ignavibacteriales bacterium]|nr:hypothetical protein [Ignavibacteriales bacterium]